MPYDCLHQKTNKQILARLTAAYHDDALGIGAVQNRAAARQEKIIQGLDGQPKAI
jgi:hypothetical protein